MNATLQSTSARVDDYGLRVAARLSAGTAELPYDISERLRAARMQAVARRKVEPVATVQSTRGGAAVLGEEHLGWWGRIASALPLLALAFGLVFIHVQQNEQRATEVAEIDAALLTDDLPPAAYADPGFVQFLKAGRESAAR
jgi:hypothetical protein